MSAHTHLGQVLPKFAQIVEDLCVDLRVFDAIDVPKDAKHPPPHYRGNVSVPSGQRAPRHDAAVLAGELAGFWNQPMSQPVTLASYHTEVSACLGVCSSVTQVIWSLQDGVVELLVQL